MKQRFLLKCCGGAGIRCIFSTRSKLPEITGPDGKAMFGEGYEFVKGKDDVVREGKDG